MMDFNLPTEVTANPAGAAWFMVTCGVAPLGQLPVLSRIGGGRATVICDGYRLETFPESMRPANDIVSHLQFHLRHEVTHFEFLARLFAKVGPADVQRWINDEPTGQYARRAAFLYEWLTGQSLQVPERLGGNYVDAIDGSVVMAASPGMSVKVPRWRVNDNLPGTPDFCPTVILSPAVMSASGLDVKALFGQLTQEFGEELLARAATWLTLRESKASFAIEGEADQASRIQRFADTLARRTGQGDSPLTARALAELQQDILGGRTTLVSFGIRQSPVFVGETVRYQEVVHYVAPPADDLPKMLEGLRVFLARTQGQSPVMRSAVAAFAFVYIHPLADGNGRVHRFLVNDVLHRDGVIPSPVILPVSAVITDDPRERQSYHRVLDSVSKPLMQGIREGVKFSPQHVSYPDGVVSNFFFDAPDVARPLWRYPDLSPHVVFMANVINRTMTEQMRMESAYLRSHAKARAAVKEIIEMPDPQVDRVLRSIEQNDGMLSNVLAKEIPALALPGVWEAVTSEVAKAFLVADRVRTTSAKPPKPFNFGR